MKDVHAIVGVATVALNALAAAWGGWAWSRGVASVSFWYFLRVAQVAVVVEVALGVVLLAQGSKVPDSLHYVYAVAPLVIAVVCEGMRVYAASREVAELDVEDPATLPRREQVLLARRIVVREIGIMTIGLILTTTLLLRAAQSGGLF